VRCGIISSCQSAATCKVVKFLQVSVANLEFIRSEKRKKIQIKHCLALIAVTDKTAPAGGIFKVNKSSYRCYRFFLFFFLCCFLYCLPFIGELKIIIYLTNI